MLFLRFVVVLKIFHFKNIFLNEQITRTHFLSDLENVLMSIPPNQYKLHFFLSKHFEYYVSDTMLSPRYTILLINWYNCRYCGRLFFDFFSDCIRLTAPLFVVFNLEGPVVLTISHLLRAEKWVYLFLDFNLDSNQKGFFCSIFS